MNVSGLDLSDKVTIQVQRRVGDRAVLEFQIDLDATAARFWPKVKVGDQAECWLWQAHRTNDGYGRFSMAGRKGGMYGAHRMAYILHYRRPIPIGFDIDHLCRVPSCVNPHHLEAVTHKVNCDRGVAAEVNRALQLSVTHCPQGHEYDEENTGYKRTGARRCKACARAFYHRTKGRRR